MVDHIRIDVAILGTVGIRRHIIRQARKLVMIMDQHKISEPGYYRFATFREADLLITNKLRPEQKERLREVRRLVEV